MKIEQRGRRSLLGPGLLVTVAAVGILRVSGHLQPGPPHPPAHVKSSDAMLVPEPAWLVRRGAEIPLDAAQAKLAATEAHAWDEETAAMRAELDQAAKSVSSGLDARGRLDQAGTQRDAEPLTRLSADLAVRRHAAWERVWTTLSEAQRSKIRELRAANPREMR